MTNAGALPAYRGDMLLAPVLDRLVKTGTLTVVDAHGRVDRFAGVDGPSVTIRLHDPALHRRLVLRPGLAFGEAYMDGTLTVEEGTLYDALDLTVGNVRGPGRPPAGPPVGRPAEPGPTGARLQPDRQGRAQRRPPLRPVARPLRPVSRRGPHLQLRIFRHTDDSLEVAQRNKLLHVAAKLCLSPGQDVLDLGSGWGGLALYLAELADVDVTGVTLSAERHRVSTETARDRGLEERVRFKLCDYRQVTGTYDRIAAVGILEHVGPQHYRTFFAKAGELLADDGVMVLHSIGRMSSPGTSTPG